MKKLIALAAASVLLFQTAYAADFIDTNGHWAQKEISTLADKGIINGFTDGSFLPEGEVTRAQYLKMVMEAVGIGTVELREGECLDADSNDWYAPYLQSALDKGLIPNQMIAGYKASVDAKYNNDGNAVTAVLHYSGAFNGNIEITREEAAYLTVTLCQYTLNANTMTKFKFTADDTSFTDEDSINEWTRNSVALAVSNGIITGMDDGSFLPTETTTRAQAAVMISRLAELIEK